MKTSAMILAMLAVLPVVAAEEQSRSTHWGAGGQMPAAKPAREDAHQRALRKYDANKDGKLDAEERKAMQKKKA